MQRSKVRLLEIRNPMQGSPTMPHFFGTPESEVDIMKERALQRRTALKAALEKLNGFSKLSVPCRNSFRDDVY